MHGSTYAVLRDYRTRRHDLDLAHIRCALGEAALVLRVGLNVDNGLQGDRRHLRALDVAARDTAPVVLDLHRPEPTAAIALRWHRRLRSEVKGSLERATHSTVDSVRTRYEAMMSCLRT